LAGCPALRPTLVDPNKRVEVAPNQGVQVPIAVQVAQGYRGAAPISQPLTGVVKFPARRSEVPGPGVRSPHLARRQHRRKYVQVPVAVQVAQSCGAHAQIAQVFQAERIKLGLGGFI
jgi:hypothetical protein